MGGERRDDPGEALVRRTDDFSSRPAQESSRPDAAVPPQQYHPEAAFAGRRRTGYPASGFKGFLLLAGAVIAALISALLVTQVAWSVSNVGSLSTVSFAWYYLVAFMVMALAGAVIPFFLGSTIERYGWILAIAYAPTYLYIVLPWVQRNITGKAPIFWGRPVPEGTIVTIGFLAIAAAVAGAFMGPMKLRLEMDRPVFALVPIALVFLGLAVLSGTTLKLSQPYKAEVKEYPQWGFEIEKPNNWGGRSSLIFSDDPLRKWADGRISLNSYSGRGQQGQVEVYVYRVMPFTGVPLDTFENPDAVYESLEATLEEVARDPEKYMHLRIADYTWYGTSTIDNNDAIRLKFTHVINYDDDWPHPMKTSNSPHGDIIVYKKPYLYWIEMNVESPLYEQIKDSFKFIPQSSKPTQ
ncbi:MAG: hypothetical protein V1748_03800 [Actinomycetota bacterium]